MCRVSSAGVADFGVSRLVAALKNCDGSVERVKGIEPSS
jgi:hypothetical protein